MTGLLSAGRCSDLLDEVDDNQGRMHIDVIPNVFNGATEDACCASGLTPDQAEQMCRMAKVG